MSTKNHAFSFKIFICLPLDYVERVDRTTRLPLAMPLLSDAIIEVPNEDNVGTLSRIRMMMTYFMMFVEDNLGFTTYLK